VDYTLTFFSWIAASVPSRKAILGLVLVAALLVAFAALSPDAFAGTSGRR
jgi:hypothetical protein